MFGASPLTPPRAKLTAFHIAVESRAQAHVIQRLLWCLWIAALSRPAATTTVIDGQSFVSNIAYDNQGRPTHAVYPQVTSAANPLLAQTFDFESAQVLKNSSTDNPA